MRTSVHKVCPSLGFFSRISWLEVGIDWDGRRQIPAVEMANRESRSAWKSLLVSLKARDLRVSGMSRPTITPAWSLPPSQLGRP
jgi:Transposase, Mutator family